MKKVGISLSGGGVKALIYTGVLQALEDNGITIDVVGGLSGGAIVGSLYAAGYSGKEILEIAKKTNLTALVKPASVIGGNLIDNAILQNTLKDYLKVETFEELKKKLIIFCSDLDNKKQVVIDKGDIASAVVGSCAIPTVIKPVIRDGIKLVDGGFSTIYGTKELRKAGARYVIGSSIENWIRISNLPSSVRDFVDAMMITFQMVAINEQKNEPVDFQLIDFGDSTNMLDLNADKQSLFDKGYKKTQENIELIKAGINAKTSILDFIFQ